MFLAAKSAQAGNLLDPEIGLFEKQLGVADSFRCQEFKEGLSAMQLDQVADPGN
jgi:hypothetical protein